MQQELRRGDLQLSQSGTRSGKGRQGKVGFPRSRIRILPDACSLVNCVTEYEHSLCGEQNTLLFGSVVTALARSHQQS